MLVTRVTFERDAGEYCVGGIKFHSESVGTAPPAMSPHLEKKSEARFLHEWHYRGKDRRATASFLMIYCRKYPACDRAFGEPPLYSCTNSYKRVLETHLEQAVAKITESYEARATNFRWANNLPVGTVQLASLVSSSCL